MRQDKRGTTTPEAAAALLLEALGVSPKTEIVPLFQALDRISAQEISAVVPQPPFSRAPLDGYALRAAEACGGTPERPVILPVSQSICAGQAAQPLYPGTAARIMTGAPVPLGADCVLRQEDTDCGREWVRLYASPKAGGNICLQGEDLALGAPVVPAGIRLEEAHLGLLAGQGIAQAAVACRPRVAVLPTGDELACAGTPLPPGKIYDANGMLLWGRLVRWGADPTLYRPQEDELESLGKRLSALLEEYPLVITTGGVSVGDKDLLPKAAAESGARILFHGLAVKPGSPALGAERAGHLLLALSGNPFAAFATLELLARPVICRLLGQRERIPPRIPAVLAAPFPKASPVRRLVRARLEGGSVTPPPQGHGAGGIAALAGCNCLIDLPAGSPAMEIGDAVEVLVL